MNKLKSHNSCKFLLQYHMIFVTKYRRNILMPMRKELLDCMEQISNRYDFTIHEQEIDKDHIHFLIESNPNVCPSQICRVLKQESTINMWKQFPNYLKKFYWKENTFWSDGYFVCTIGNASEDTIRKYIESQGS